MSPIIVPAPAATPGIADCPVLDNSLVRVRYDAAVGKPGFRVDMWNGAAYSEQGKMTVQRIGDVTGYCDTWVSAGLVEYTPDRAVMLCVLANSADANSRERVFVTLQRGEIGATFEVYPALKADAVTQADAQLTWTPAQADNVDSLLKVDSQTQPPPAGNGKYVSTAGSGSSLFGATATLGAGSFASSENYVAILRCSAVNSITAYQHAIVVLQAGIVAKYNGTDTSGYGAAQNNAQIVGTGGLGYVQAQINFSPTQAQQVMAAHAMSLGANTASGADANAADGTTTTSTRTTDANAHVTQVTWPNGFTGTFRVTVRVKVSANTGSVYAKTGATTGAIVTTTSTSYVELDLGEISANNSTLEIHAWIPAGGTISVDRIEAVLTSDRARTTAIYSGARDQGQSALFDARTLGALVAR